MIIVKCKKVVNFYTQVQSVNILELILSKSTKQYQVWNNFHLILACGSNCLKMGAIFIKILLIKRNYADAMNTQFFSNWFYGKSIWSRPMKSLYKNIKYYVIIRKIITDLLKNVFFGKSLILFTPCKCLSLNLLTNGPRCWWTNRRTDKAS